MTHVRVPAGIRSRPSGRCRSARRAVGPAARGCRKASANSRAGPGRSCAARSRSRPPGTCARTWRTRQGWPFSSSASNGGCLRIDGEHRQRPMGEIAGDRPHMPADFDDMRAVAHEVRGKDLADGGRRARQMRQVLSGACRWRGGFKRHRIHMVRVRCVAQTSQHTTRP